MATRHLYTVLLAVGLAGCAGGIAQPLSQTAARSDSATSVSPTPHYIPTDQEQAYDCRRLTGMIQVRLLQLRVADDTAPATSAQAVVRAVKASFQDGGVVWREERARLEALNGLLAQKGCPTFDIAAELSGQHGVQNTPRPVAARR